MPTLLEKGTLVPNAPNPVLKDELDRYVAIDYILEWFRQRINRDVNGPKDRVLVLKADTGSGKSTVLPAYLFKTFIEGASEGGKQTIAVTQPRVLTAIDIARGIADRYKLQLGESVGWVTGPNKRRGKYGLSFMTIGVLSMQISTMTDEEFMRKYRIVIIDEVHEMSPELLLLLNKIKSLLKRNRTNKQVPFVVVTSATFDTEKYLRYFEVYDEKALQPNFINVTGSTFPKTDHFEFEYGVKDFMQEAAQLAHRVHMENLDDNPAQSDILIFTTGKRPMQEISRHLEQMHKDSPKGKDFVVLNIDSAAVNKATRDYNLAFTPADKIAGDKISGDKMSGDKNTHPYIRKIIISTNVAETGLTINTLKYCIDSGYHKGTEYYPIEDCVGLIERPANKARVTQRRGRVGRVFPGHFYPLYPKYIYDTLPQKAFSDVEIGDTSHIVMPLLMSQLVQGGFKMDDLRLKGAESFSMDLFKPIMDTRLKCVLPVSLDRLDTADVISNDALLTYGKKLLSVGYIRQVVSDSTGSNNGESSDIPTRKVQLQMTLLGICMAKLPLGLESMRSIVAAYYWGVSPLDMIAVAAYLSVDWLDFRVDKRELPRQSVNWLELYRQGLPNFLFHNVKDTAHWIYKVRLIIGDEFIEGAVIMNAVMRLIKYEKVETIVQKVSEWSTLVRVPYTTMLSMLKVRDDIIEQMINCGFDPFITGASLDDVDETEFMNYIVRMKYCILDGYRQNTLLWDEGSSSYVTSAGLQVIPPIMFAKNEISKEEQRKTGLGYSTPAKVLLYNSLTLKYDSRENIYKPMVDRVSSMDGYVYFDV